MTGKERAVVSREQAKILRQMTEIRSKMSKANIDTTVIDGFVGSRMVVMNDVISRAVGKPRVCSLWAPNPLILS